MCSQISRVTQLPNVMFCLSIFIFTFHEVFYTQPPSLYFFMIFLRVHSCLRSISSYLFCFLSSKIPTCQYFSKSHSSLLSPCKHFFHYHPFYLDCMFQMSVGFNTPSKGGIQFSKLQFHRLSYYSNCSKNAIDVNNHLLKPTSFIFSKCLHNSQGHSLNGPFFSLTLLSWQFLLILWSH